jgi:hypothetical protein
VRRVGDGARAARRRRLRRRRGARGGRRGRRVELRRERRLRLRRLLLLLLLLRESQKGLGPTVEDAADERDKLCDHVRFAQRAAHALDRRELRGEGEGQAREDRALRAERQREQARLEDGPGTTRTVRGQFADSSRTFPGPERSERARGGKRAR